MGQTQRLRGPAARSPAVLARCARRGFPTRHPYGCVCHPPHTYGRRVSLASLAISCLTIDSSSFYSLTRRLRMNRKQKLIGASLSAAVALTFISLPTPTLAEKPAFVKCYGINKCAGTSQCRLVTSTCRVLHECKGQNTCRGKGVIWKTPENCKRLGGSAPSNPDALKDN